MNYSIPFHAIIPAAGSGKRAKRLLPKQYEHLLGKPMIEHALDPILATAGLIHLVVVLSPHDQEWEKTNLSHHPRILTTIGGDTRQASVLQGLMALQDHAKPKDWILVHDAARPCLQHIDIQQLMANCEQDEIGGLLAIPVRDTLKSVADNQRVMQTIDREQCYLALTPQLFRFELLFAALLHAQKKNIIVTDEAMAIELLGESPKIIVGRRDNIKITEPEDFALAEYYLRQQGRCSLQVYSKEQTLAE